MLDQLRENKATLLQCDSCAFSASPGTLLKILISTLSINVNYTARRRQLDSVSFDSFTLEVNVITVCSGCEFRTTGTRNLILGTHIRIYSKKVKCKKGSQRFKVKVK